MDFIKHFARIGRVYSSFVFFNLLVHMGIVQTPTMYNLTKNSQSILLGYNRSAAYKKLQLYGFKIRLSNKVKLEDRAQ
eukprot:c24620_g1_i1 orf=199-432(-)